MPATLIAEPDPPLPFGRVKRPSVLLSIAIALLLAGCGSSSSTTTPSPSATTPSTGNSTPATQTSTSRSTTAATQTGTSSGPLVLGFEGMPIQQGPDLAPASTTGTRRVDGITCAPTEQLVYHIHSHLAVYDNGKLLALPGGVGIPGSKILVYQGYGPVATGGHCIYWLHTHAPDGVIHIESPVARVYTLGNFFDEWRQPLSSDNVAGLPGKLTAIVNGRLWPGSPRNIPLLPHAIIQLDIGAPTVPFQAVSWAGTGL
jgi:uncharacterized protein YceK